MKKHLSSIFRFTLKIAAITTILIVLLVGVLFIVSQTEFARSQTRVLLERVLSSEESNFRVSVGAVTALTPFSISVDEIVFYKEERVLFKVRTFRGRWLAVFQPGRISLSSYTIERLRFFGKDGAEGSSVDLAGSAYWRWSDGSLTVRSRIESPEFPDSSLMLKGRLGKNAGGEWGGPFRLGLIQTQEAVMSRVVSLTGNYLIQQGGSILVDFDGESGKVGMRGSLSLSSELEWIGSTVYASLPELSYLHPSLEGSAKVEAFVSGPFATPLVTANVYSPKLVVEEEQLERINAKLELRMGDGVVLPSGIIHFEGEREGRPLIFASNYQLGDSYLHFADSTLQYGGSRLVGDTRIELKEKTLQSTLTAEIPSLAPFSSVAHQFLEGQVSGAVMLSGAWSDPTFSANLKGQQVRYGDFRADTVLLSADLSTLFSAPTGRIQLESVAPRWDEVHSGSLRLSLVGGATEWNYAIESSSLVADTLGIHSMGRLSLLDGGFHLTVDSLAGTHIKTPFKLQERAHLIRSEKELRLSQFHLGVGEGQVALELQDTQEALKIDGVIDELPLELMNHLLLPLPLEGKLNGHIALQITDGQASGISNISVHNLRFQNITLAQLPPTQLFLSAELADSSLNLSGELKNKGEVTISGAAALPLLINGSHLQVDTTQPLSGRFHIAEEIQPISQILLLDAGECSGKLVGKLKLQGTLVKPVIKGALELKDGRAESFLTGGVLKDISAVVEANGNTIQLKQLSATDGDKGSLKGSGQVRLDQGVLIPYRANLSVDQLQLFALDNFLGKVSGEIGVEGSMEGAKVAGELTLNNADITLPDRLPPNVPRLDVVFTDKVDISASTEQPQGLVPVVLDLALVSPGRMFVRGQGLDSEWRGSLRAVSDGGDVKLHGALALVRGRLDVAGRRFDLTHGEINLNGTPPENTRITISATTQVQDVAIQVDLQGPVQEPTLTFRSTPPLPTSEIISRILFNNAESDISPIQAVILAHAITQITGGNYGPDLITRIRRTLHIDELEFRGSNADSDALGIRFGKYLTDRIFLSYGREFGTDRDEVSIETAIRKNLRFKFEVDSDAESSFRILWRKRY